MSIELDLIDSKNNKVDSLSLNKEVFNVSIKKFLLHNAVVAYLRNKRSGCASTKTRDEVRGGGVKPWKQKGTGRARAGSIRTPLKRGGGVTFGPKPRDYNYKISKKEKKEAIKTALSLKFNEGNLVLIDKIELEQPKTKTLTSFIEQIGISNKKVLIIIDKENKNLELAARNIKNININYANKVNTYNILYYDKILFLKDAIDCLTTRLIN